MNEIELPSAEIKYVTLISPFTELKEIMKIKEEVEEHNSKLNDINILKKFYYWLFPRMDEREFMEYLDFSIDGREYD